MIKMKKWRKKKIKLWKKLKLKLMKKSKKMIIKIIRKKKEEKKNNNLVDDKETDKKGKEDKDKMIIEENKEEKKAENDNNIIDTSSKSLGKKDEKKKRSKSEEKREDEEEEEEVEKKPGFRIEAKGAIKNNKDPINDTKSEDENNPRYLLNQMYQRCDPSKQKDIIITKNEVIFIVGESQRISIAKVNGKVEMDFRSYHFDDVMFLGKYGLNMNLRDWDNLKKKMKEIDEAIYKLSH